MPKPKSKPASMLMDIKMVAAFWGKSVRHTRRLIEEQQIPVIQINRKYFYKRSDILPLKPK